MKNSDFASIKYRFIEMCEEENVYWTDALLYMIYNEYPVGMINEELGDVREIKEHLKEEYDVLWDMQPSLEEDADKAFAIQHARDIYDVLLGREGEM